MNGPETWGSPALFHWHTWVISQGVLLQDVGWPLKWSLEALQGTTACPGVGRICHLNWVVFLGHWRQWPSLLAFGKVAVTPLLAGKLSSGQRLQPWLCHQLLLQLCPGCFPRFTSWQQHTRIIHPWRAFFSKYITVLPENKITATNYTPFASNSTKPTSLLLVQCRSCIWLYISFTSPRGAVQPATFSFPP